MISTTDFEAARPQLTALAHRLLGSVHDAEDAVQNAWIRSANVDGDDLRNPAAWLTTVVTRLCLDQLRAGRRRDEQLLLADADFGAHLEIDENYLRREQISRALMVVLEQLTPTQRVAYVLHDCFGFSFGAIASILQTTPDSAKKHASRSRARIEAPTSAQMPSNSAIEVADAFVAAAGGGDIDRMVELLTQDCVRIVDAELVPPGTRIRVCGARHIAEETRLFTRRIQAITPILVDGRRAYLIAPGGQPFAVIDVNVVDHRVTEVNIHRATASMAYRLLPGHCSTAGRATCRL